MSIATRINEMSSHIEQAYDELQGLGADLTNVNKNIENISMVLDNIYDSMPQVSGEDTNLTLDNTRVGKIKSTLKGNVSQTTYSGKNLANTKVTNWSYLGVSVSYDETTQVLTINGTSTGNAGLNFQNYNFSNINVSNGERINLVVEYISGSATSNDNGRVLLADTNYTMSMTIPLNGINTTKTEYRNISSDLTYNNLQIAYRTGDVYNNLKIKIMVCKGSDISYEPYVGGTALPNPSYPQPVNVVSGDNEINVCGKNLFDNGKITRGGSYSYRTTGGVPTYTGSNARATISPTNSIKVLPSTTYTLTFPISGFRYALAQMESGYIRLGDSGWKTDTTYTFTTNATTNYIGFNFSKTDNSAISDSEWGTLKNGAIQLEVGSSATSYEPYQGNAYNIDLPVENLLQLNDGSITSNGITSTITNGKLKIVGTTTENWFSICDLNIPLESGTYTFSYTNKKISRYNFRIRYEDNTTGTIYGNTDRNTPITLSQKATIIRMSSDINTVGATFDYEDYLMIEKGLKANTYTPYGTTPIELCKIPNTDYEDTFLHDKTTDKWYLHKEIGKYEINGNEATDIGGTSFASMYAKGYLVRIFTMSDLLSQNTRANIISNCFSVSKSSLWDATREGIQQYLNANKVIISASSNDIETYYGTTLNINNYIGAYLNYLVHIGTQFYYVLATPTNIEITYQSLIDQLNELEKATSYENQTNISQKNNNLPFIINATALLKNSD